MLKTRQTFLNSKDIRNFITPTLNNNAVDYTELINWNEAKLSFPSLFRRVINEKIHFVSYVDPDKEIDSLGPH